MKTLRYPLQIDATGRAVVTSDPDQQTRDRIAVLLSTMYGERPEDLGYGAQVEAALFEAAEDIGDLVTEQVETALSTYLPDVMIQDVTVSSLDDESGKVSVSVTFVDAANEEQAVLLAVDAT